MVIFSNSCVCQSTNKIFRIVAHENTKNSNFLCGNDSEIAINLETQDYEALGLCQPPVMDQYFSIGLRFPDINTDNRGFCNSSHPYFWRTRRNEAIYCVDGSPLELRRNFNGDRRCNLASVLPGSLDQIYNATWTRCNSVQYSICQLERNASIFNFCKNVSTAIPSTTTATTVLSSNITAIITGSVLGVFAVIVLLWLLIFFRKRNNLRRNASDHGSDEEVYYK